MIEAVDVYLVDATPQWPYNNGTYHYIIMADGKVYDQFSSTRRLTHSEMNDVEAGYREVLTPR